MIKAAKYPIIFLTGYLIASAGAWYHFIGYRYEPMLIFEAWKQLGFLKMPHIVYMSTLIGVSFIVYFAYPKDLVRKAQGKYGYAKFARRVDIKKFGLNFREGIILGKAFNNLIRSKEPLSLLVLAPPGTGKTAGIVIPTLLTLQNSVVVHDPKGELFEVTSKVRSTFSRVHLFDPLANNSCNFNPLHKSMLPKEQDDVKGYIRNVASILFKEAREGDKYFIDAARSAFNFFAEWLIWKNGSTSLPEVRSKLLEEADVGKSIKMMIATDGIPEELKQDGNGVLVSEESEKQWAGVVGTLKEGIEIFADPRIKKVTGGECDFTGEDLRKENISIYLKVRDKDAKRLEPLITMLLEAVGSQLISSMPEKDDMQVTFVLDEFVRLGKTEIIRDLPAISRGYNVNTLFIAQDYEQIAVKYGREAVSIFDSNCAYKVIFRQNNSQTAEKISKMIGNVTSTRKTKSKSANLRNMALENQSTGRSESIGEEGIALVTAQDILNLPEDRCLILAQGFLANPINAKIPYYFKEKSLTKLLEDK